MLAVEQNVAPNTQGQAKSALLMLFQTILGREVGFLDIVAADETGEVAGRAESQRNQLTASGV